MPSKTILLLANSAWNLWNYRSALICRLINTGYTVLLAAPEDGYESRLLQKHPSVQYIPIRKLSRRSLSPFQNLKALLEYRGLLLQVRPDLVLLYTIKPNILGNLAARMTRTHTVSIVEGLGYSGTQAARWRWLAVPLLRLALKQAKKVVFLNQDDAQEFEQSRIVRSGQIMIVPGPGIDLSHFQKSAAPVRSQIVFLYCGRLLAEKGIREYLEAARQLHQQGKSAFFQVVGSPDHGNPSSISAQELELWKETFPVQFYGHTDDVRPYLANADVLVLPSYYREGVPRSVLEAMAMGKIVVTANMPGCRDTVEAGKNGFLVPPRNVEALIQIFDKILTLEREQRHWMGNYSREKVEREFSDDRVLPQFLQLIESLLNSK